MMWSFRADDAAAADGMRGPFVAYLRSRSVPDSDFLAAELIFGELVSNVVRHAPGPIAIVVEWVSQRAVLTVSDEGPGFAPGHDTALPDTLSEGGRGLFLLRAYAERIQVRPRAGGGSSVSVELPVRRSQVA